MNLQDKNVVIIGGSQGFGKALAIGFIAEGANVVIASKNLESVNKTGEEIGATSMVCDVKNEDSIKKVAQATIEEFGSIDIWINSAGVFKVFPVGENVDMEKAREMFDINFFGSVVGSRTALVNMREKGGTIINILSSAALDATRSKNAKLYAASKWALRGYVDALRAENKDSKVNILSLYPGGMKTHLHDERLPADFENFMDPEYVVEKVINNLKLDNPEQDLIIKRPTA
jgi:NAD(P)-dependent dehydrogenase (short-subunit alcohol dehydrogenase family)